MKVARDIDLVNSAKNSLYLGLMFSTVNID